MFSTGFVLSAGGEEFGSADARVDHGGASYSFRWDDPGLGWSQGNEVTVSLVQSDQNTPALGAPTISGTAQVGETLTADTSGVEDADGLEGAVFSYQWVRLDGGVETSIGTDSSSYTLVPADEGKTIAVRVSFADDADNNETLTSAATAAVAEAADPAATGAPAIGGTAQVGEKPKPDVSGIVGADLTVGVTVAAAASHDGSSEFTFEIEFSEEFGISYVTLKTHAFNVTGGEVRKAQRTNRPSNITWRITVRPTSTGDVTIQLPATTDCEATGAICTGDGRKLSNSLNFTVSGPGQ